jgi:hypothetical protein
MEERGVEMRYKGEIRVGECGGGMDDGARREGYGTLRDEMRWRRVGRLKRSG